MLGRLRRPAPDPLAEGVGAELDRRLRRDTRAPLAIGLSGGGDSLALLHLAAAWAGDAGRPLLALTVDHGLSPQSSGWTARAGAMARAAGAHWRALAWTGPKPAAGLPAAARAARHRLLADAARAAGASVVIMAHTADDAAEGEWMRETGATPTLGRLRGWTSSPVWPEGRGVFLLRPLLGTSRAELRAWLVARSLAWIDDPANADPRFARTRARAALEGAGETTPSAPAPDLARFAGLVQAAADGSLCAPLSGLLALPAGAHALAALLLCAGGGDRPPSGDAIARALARLGEEDSSFTLAGARVHRKGACVRITRELGRRRPAPSQLSVGETVVWDGRFEVTVGEPGWTVQPLAGLSARLSSHERLALRTSTPAARGVLPALVSTEGLVRLAPPFGAAPALVRPLAHDRLLAACGGVTGEP